MITCILLHITFLSNFLNPRSNVDGHLNWSIPPISVQILILGVTGMVTRIFLSIPYLSTFLNPTLYTTYLSNFLPNPRSNWDGHLHIHLSIPYLSIILGATGVVTCILQHNPYLSIILTWMITCMLLYTPYLSNFLHPRSNLDGQSIWDPRSNWSLAYSCLSPISVPFLILEVTGMITCILLYIPFLSTNFNPRGNLDDHLYIAAYHLSQ